MQGRNYVSRIRNFHTKRTEDGRSLNDSSHARSLFFLHSAYGRRRFKILHALCLFMYSDFFPLIYILFKWTFWVAQMVKNMPAMHQTQETWIWSLGREDPLVEEMVTHSSILAWRIPWTEEPGGLQSMGSQRVGHGWACMHAHSL